jgi:hypothetical protein
MGQARAAPLAIPIQFMYGVPTLTIINGIMHTVLQPNKKSKTAKSLIIIFSLMCIIEKISL